MGRLTGLLGSFLDVREKERPEVLEVRQDVLNKLMILILWCGFPAILLGSAHSFLQGDWIFSALYLALYCSVLVTTAFGTRLPFVFRSLCLVGAFFIMSIAAQIRVGLSGTGMLLMTVPCILAALLMGARAGLITLGLGIVGISMVGIGMISGRITILHEHMLTSLSPMAWLVDLGTFFIVTMGLVTFPERFFARLKDSLDLQEKHGSRLKRSNDILKGQIRTRKKAERALQESNSQFRLIYQMIPDPVTLVRDRDGMCIDVNEQFVLQTGWTREEVIGREFRSLNMWLHPGDSKEMMETISRHGRVHNLEARFRLKNGEVVTVLLSAISLTIGGEQLIVAITRDITERDRAEKALKESEEKYRFVVDNAIEWMVLTQNREIVFANRAAIEQSGYSQEEFSTRELSSFIHPDDREEAILRYLSKINGGNGKGDYAFRILCKNGKAIWVRVNSFPVNWMGKPALLNYMNDITRQKEMEAEKERLQASLQRAQKMEAIGTLAGGVAHDLNNILSGIVSYPDLLLMQLPVSSPLIKPVMTIKESGKRAAAVVQDLLTLARRGLAVAEPVDLNALIADFLKSAELERLRSIYPHVRVEIRLKQDLHNMQGSPVHLQKTLMNLVLNAFEAMPQGGTMVISTEKRHLGNSLNGYDNVHEGEYLVLKVSDTGVGISPEDRERIFEPFYTKKAMGRSGTGLGMAVVWGTVKDHNGYIDVESTPGKGTSFTLYFPATTDPARKTPDISMDYYRGRGESILVIDDMEDQREIASTLLGRLGYSVSSVSSGEEAVRRMSRNPVDLLVVDMIMNEGMDGLDTYREILKVRPAQKAIIASGYSETERVKEAQKLGAGEYIRKPYTLERIGMAVRNELDGVRP